MSSKTLSSSSHPLSCSLLSLPAEIRLKLYTLLFHCAERLIIEPANPTSQHEFDGNDKDDQYSSSTWEMRMNPLRFCRPAYLTGPLSPSNYGLGLSSQLLRVCHQIHNEAIPILYGVNRFDCSLRSAPDILSKVVSSANFARICHLILDWEQLQDFAWSLAKDEKVHATRGLEILELSHFRTRIFRSSAEEQRLGILPDPGKGGRSQWLFEDTKSYERQIHQAALEICQKHAQLRYVLQETTRRSLPRGYQETDSHGTSRPIPEFRVSARIRWRFVTENGLRTRTEDEEIVDLASEVALASSPSLKDEKQWRYEFLHRSRGGETADLA